jgi:hypothetical protein
MKVPPLLLLLLFLFLAAAPPPPAPVEGSFVLREMEVASELRLGGNGRFQWFFSTGALDLTGEGRWAEESDGTLSLTSDPPVVPPRFELVSATRDGKGGVLVRLADEAGRTPSYLEASAEYADGSSEHSYFEDGEHRFRPRKGRIVAVRLGSPPFELVSERYPVTSAGNALTFRFHANDLGKQSFRGTPVHVEPDALTLTWRGRPLRYGRAMQADDEAE